MKKNVFGALCMSLLISCEQQEISVNDGVLSDALQVEAEITSSGGSLSRTTTVIDGKVSFAAGDKIGLYSPLTTTSGSWTFSDNVWTTTDTYFWPDKTSTHDFCAYYPFTTGQTRDAITMPNLSAQQGLLSELGKYDFLVARHKTDYNTSKGVVSFTGEQAFKHVYALMSITLKANDETKGSALTDISLKAPDIVSTYTYHFGELAEDDGMTQSKAINELALSGLDATIDNDGYQQVFVVNPLGSSEEVEIAIAYTRDGQTYKAATKVSAENIQKGYLNKLNILVKKSGLEVKGNTIEDWVVNNLDDIAVEETPAEK